MSAHARLSPSSAERWMQCPGSIGLVERLGVPEESAELGSIWADEGTKAHEVAEIHARLHFKQISKAEYTRRMRRWRVNTPEEYHEDQIFHAQTYVGLLRELYDGYEHAQIMLEQRMSTGVPGCWGTGDAVIVTPDTIHVVDYKYGKGVWVDAHENPQLKLYALGALETFGLLGEIETVRITVHQPRLDQISTFTMDVTELRRWRDNEVKPVAELALSGEGYLAPSDTACRWCPAAGACKARAEYFTKRDFGDPDLLSDEELAGLLELLPSFRAWCKDIETRALVRAYNEGATLPGWKVVRAGGKRVITNTDKAIELLNNAGFSDDEISRVTLQTLEKLDKLVGKTGLANVLGELLVKTEGREALVPEDDPRPAVDALSDAQRDFGAQGSGESEVK